jgi:hypothetical protein
VAIDRFENPRFLEIQERTASRIDYRQMSVYELDPNKIGRFDIVLFMGVLYHLKHPLLALERVCSVAEDLVAVESFVLRDRQRPGLGVEEFPLMEFYENDEFGGEFDNWIAPSIPCLLALCRTAGFAHVEIRNVHEYGAALACHRKWKSLSQAPKSKLNVLSAFHSDNFGRNFQASSSDEYVSCTVAAAATPLSLDTVRPEVSGYGVRPVFVGRVEGGWLVNFKLPPGLSPGWHEVRLGTADAESNAVAIAVDLPIQAESLKITSACNGLTWEPFRVSKDNPFVAIWVHGLPGNADRNNVRVFLAGKRQITDFVGLPGDDGISQINATVQSSTPLGGLPLTVRFGEGAAEPVILDVSA